MARPNESPETFKVEDGKIVANGNRSHLFYVGDVKNHVFKNFELRAQVLCKPNSNSGIYFHTEFQEKDWPAKGFECQVCSNEYPDKRKTGSLYAVKDVAEMITEARRAADLVTTSSADLGQQAADLRSAVDGFIEKTEGIAA